MGVFSPCVLSVYGLKKCKTYRMSVQSLAVQRAYLYFKKKNKTSRTMII